MLRVNDSIKLTTDKKTVVFNVTDSNGQVSKVSIPRYDLAKVVDALNEIRMEAFAGW